MPIYEYECEVCGVLEVLQKVSEEPLTECPKCADEGRKNSIKKAVSASAFHLKGSGWYKTDYTSSGSSPKSEEKPTTSTETKSEEKKTETAVKPETKKCGSGCGCN